MNEVPIEKLIHIRELTDDYLWKSSPITQEDNSSTQDSTVFKITLTNKEKPNPEPNPEPKKYTGKEIPKTGVVTSVNYLPLLWLATGFIFIKKKKD